MATKSRQLYERTEKGLLYELEDWEVVGQFEFLTPIVTIKKIQTDPLRTGSCAVPGDRACSTIE